MSHHTHEECLQDAYAEQLTDIGKMMVEAKLMTGEDIKRHGVRFAVRHALEERGLLPKTLSDTAAE